MPASQKGVSDSIKMTVAYLKACNKLFERGILGKRVFIKNMACPIVHNMEEGFKFFSSWLDEKLLQGKNTHINVIDDTLIGKFLGYKIRVSCFCLGRHGTY